MENESSFTSDNESDGPALNHLLHSKSRVLRTKLGVLASEIQARFAIWDRNLDRLDQDQSDVDSQLGEASRLARYHLRDAREATRFREASLQLDAQRREQDIQCWRDVVQVMRDFLYNWEVHEQAKNRSAFLNHAGTGSEDYL
jgi:hypothetical protein